MGKSAVKTKISRKTVTQQPLKHSRARKRIQKFIQTLRKTNNFSTQQYLVQVHNFMRSTVRNSKDLSVLLDPYPFVRVCKKCQRWRKSSALIECYQCQDLYHQSCITNKEKRCDEWICESCEEICRYNQRAEENSKSNKLPGKRYFCKDCRREIAKEELESCIYCLNDYHKKCFMKERKGLVCRECDVSLTNKITKDIDEMEQQRTKMEIEDRLWNESELSCQKELQINYSKAFYFKAPPIISGKTLRKCRQSLLYAIYSKHMNYTQQLVFQTKNKRSLLSIDLELQHINPKDTQAFKTYKRQPIGPFEVIPVDGFGYDVRAIQQIPKDTIVCEYVGQVISKRTAIKNNIKNDSLMELVTSNDADTSMLIRPEKYTNIARFINGVNNQDSNACKKINVQSLRLMIDGRPRVILFTRRSINKGESLQYDYNAGGKRLFPTEDFI